jgi:hypothetical protein
VREPFSDAHYANHFRVYASEILAFLQISALFIGFHFPISPPPLPNIIAAKFPAVKEKFPREKPSRYQEGFSL